MKEEILEAMRTVIIDGGMLVTENYNGTNPEAFGEFAEANEFDLDEVVEVYRENSDELEGLWDESHNTYDVMFSKDLYCDSKGMEATKEECIDYIKMNNGTKDSYFEDYVGGVVSVVCNETDEVVYKEEVRRPRGNEEMDEEEIKVLEDFFGKEVEKIGDNEALIDGGWYKVVRARSLPIHSLRREDKYIKSCPIHEYDGEKYYIVEQL